MWTEKRPLTLLDFKVVSDHTKAVKPNVAALTRTGITYSLSSEKNSKNTANITIMVYATVHKPNTFIKQKVLRLPLKRRQQLLNHEQIHFDISEVFARRITQSLQTLPLTRNYQKEIGEFVKGMFKQAENYQYLYDEETANGENDKGQNKWNEKIEKELRDLENYKNKRVKRKVQL